MDDDLIKRFKFVFGTEAGREVLKHLSEFCAENADGFNAASERVSCYYQGRRSVVLEIRKILNTEIQEKK